MAELEHYLEAATRANTRRSYATALRHFEIEWGGHLPTTPDSVARYLVDQAGQFSSNTLRQRLAALAHWHREHGFVDPTRAPCASAQSSIISMGFSLLALIAKSS